MNRYRIKAIVTVFVLFTLISLGRDMCRAQVVIDQLSTDYSKTDGYEGRVTFRSQDWYLYTIPLSLIATGTVMLNRLGWFEHNVRVRDVLRYREYKARYVDDVLQLLPITITVSWDAYTYVKYSHWQPIVETASSIATMTLLVHGIKWIGLEERPDRSAWNSFPSGHTATAFVGAELLRERMGIKYWYIAALGYGAALTTAYLRIYHNRHWLGDTLAGAGIGILSAWVGSNLTRLCFKRYRD